MSGTISRRAFLGGALGSAFLLPGLPSLANVSNVASLRQTSANHKGLQDHFINGHIDADGRHYVSGLNAKGVEQFRLPLPDKAHGFAVNPRYPSRIVSLPTLPGTRAVAMDVANGKQLAVIHSRDGRHFNGHGVFNPDGSLFFSSENIAATGEGVITIRDGKNFRYIRELPGFGIGPHDLRLLPNGTTLVVAGGGILTHPDSGKRELNINRMQTALLFIDSERGNLIARRETPIAKLSIRHIDVGADGTVLVACQYKGKRLMPRLVGMQKGDGEIEMLAIDDANLWRLNNYTASALIADNSVAAVSCPRGNRLTFWDLKQKKFIKSVEINDVGGIEIAADGINFIASANKGELYRIDSTTLQVTQFDEVWQDVKWTNHMVKTIV